MLFWWMDLWIKFWFGGFQHKEPENTVISLDDERERRKKRWV